MLNVWQRYVTDESGDIIPNPEVEVRDEDSGDLVPLFSDVDGNTSLGNPFMGGADGFTRFYADAGRYNVTVTKTTNTSTFRNVQLGNVQSFDYGNQVGQIPLNYSAPLAATDGGTDVFQFDAGGDISDGDVLTLTIPAANSTASPTLDNTGGLPTGSRDIVTTAGVAFIGMLEARAHFFEWRATPGEWVVLDPAGGLAVLDPESPSQSNVASEKGVVDYISNLFVTPQNFDAVGDGVADDSDAVENALKSGQAIYWGGPDKEYRITREISHTLTAPLMSFSAGAKITLDTASSIQRAMHIDLDGFPVDMRGPLFLDCDDNAYSGWHFYNVLAANRTDISLNGFRVSNCYRSGTDFNGGTGIYVRGAYGKVHIDDAIVKNVYMATGAGVALSQGVSGIDVVKDPPNDTDAFLAIVENFFIENIYSEDETYTNDQDGIKLFSVWDDHPVDPSQSKVIVRDGRIKNAMGRAVKLQAEWGSVSGLMIVRDEAIWGDGYIGQSDIDFQTGGGHVYDLQCYYEGNFPVNVIKYTIRRDDDREHPVAAMISKISVTQLTPGDGAERIVYMTSDEDDNYHLFAESVTLKGTIYPDYGFLLEATAASRFDVVIDKYAGRALNAVLHRAGATAQVNATGIGLFLNGASAKFYTEENAGSSNITVLGSNRQIDPQ